MASDKSKIIRPDNPDAPRISDVPRPNPRHGIQGMEMPGESQTGTTSPSITASQPAEPSNRPPSEVSPTRSQPSLQERAKETAGEVSEQVQQRVSDFYQRVDGFVRSQVEQRPIGMVAGSFAAGYVLSAGMPRWVLRSVMRVGLPLFAVGYLGRILSEGRLDRMGDASEHRTPHHTSHLDQTPRTFR